MATANSIAELEQMILADIKKGMEEVKDQAEEYMDQELHMYYTSGYPHMYKRTYHLMDTPETSDVKVDNAAKTVTFKAYLSQDYRYATGHRPTMSEVIELTNTGKTSKNLGVQSSGTHRHYWENSELKIKNSVYRIVAGHLQGK